MNGIKSNEELRELALAATPGPWEVGLAGDYPAHSLLADDFTPIHSDTWGAFCSVVTDIENGGGRVGTSEQGKANAAFIAAFNPSTSLALVDRVERLTTLLTEAFAAIAHAERGEIDADISARYLSTLIKIRAALNLSEETK